MIAMLASFAQSNRVLEEEATVVAMLSLASRITTTASLVGMVVAEITDVELLIGGWSWLLYFCCLGLWMNHNC